MRSSLFFNSFNYSSNGFQFLFFSIFRRWGQLWAHEKEFDCAHLNCNLDLLYNGRDFLYNLYVRHILRKWIWKVILSNVYHINSTVESFIANQMSITWMQNRVHISKQKQWWPVARTDRLDEDEKCMTNIVNLCSRTNNSSLRTTKDFSFRFYN